ncbi:tyrosine-type recombinase/integrase [Thermomicrobium sp. 4228-Ro]|uniref:tyrosine-type recombinase/integrase n=1 Tax=Thermomicrobium sp. 4228-Ro TaxID=2993937 RepID=UPI0022498BC7|nr:tyrosine-type recombinase/integrase [Thermomicrobium sp. 4228-Ro]MCX2725970.1 tyrosine-type recombinase/integrase [Thermomicrobium sp. 4228-Ro]
MGTNQQEQAASTVSITGGSRQHLPPGVRQKGNRYEGRVKVNGKQYTVSGATPEEAYLALQQLKARLNQRFRKESATDHRFCEEPVHGRGWQPCEPLTLEQLLEQWMRTHTEWKPRTRHDYQELAERWVLPLLGSRSLSDLQPRQIEELLAYMPTRQAAKVYAMLKAALNAGYRWGLIEENLMERVSPPRYRTPRKALPPLEQVARALAENRHHPWWPWFALAVSTGMRPGEQAALRWEDWSPEENVLWVRRSGQYIDGTWVETPPKTYAGDRRITLPTPAQVALQAQRERVPEGISLVFPSRTGKPYSAWGINDGLKRFCRESGLPPLTPHQLRHYHASILVQQGLPLTLISRRLGHASPEVTARIYAHWLGADDRAAAQAIDATFPPLPT